jgi:hypothetical protein
MKEDAPIPDVPMTNTYGEGKRFQTMNIVE